MKDAYYFSHDSNATDDPKMAALISKYGFEGYGWFWRIIELLRDQPNYKYPVNKYTFDAIAMQLHCDRNAAYEFINDCCHEFATFDGALLCMDDNFMWSESLIRRMKVLDDARETARKAAKARWERKNNADAMRKQCDSNASKVNKSKVNNNIVVEQGDEEDAAADEKTKRWPEVQNYWLSLSGNFSNGEEIKELLRLGDGDADLVKDVIKTRFESYKPRSKGQKINSVRYFHQSIIEAATSKSKQDLPKTPTKSAAQEIRDMWESEGVNTDGAH